MLTVKPIYFYISRAVTSALVCGLSEHPRIATSCCKTCRIRWVKVTDPREALFNILSRAYVATKGEKMDTTTCPTGRATWKIRKSRGRSCETNCNVRPFRRTYRLSGTYIQYIRRKPLLLYSAFQFIEPYYCVDTHKCVLHIYARVHYIGLPHSSFRAITCFFSKIGGTFLESKFFLQKAISFNFFRYSIILIIKFSIEKLKLLRFIKRDIHILHMRSYHHYLLHNFSVLHHYITIE